MNRGNSAHLDLNLSLFQLFPEITALLLQVLGVMFGSPELKVQLRLKFPCKERKFCLISLLLCCPSFFSFFPSNLNCKPQFLIKLKTILKLSFTKFWVLVPFRYFSSGFSDGQNYRYLQYSDYNENCSFTGIFSEVFYHFP